MPLRSIARVVLCFCFTAALSLPAAAQSNRDKKRAEKLTAGNQALKDLSTDEREAVLRHIAYKIHASHRKIKGVAIKTLDGKTISSLISEKNKRYKGYRIVYRDKGSNEVPAPPKTEIKTNPVTLKHENLYGDNKWIFGDTSGLDMRAAALVNQSIAKLGKQIDMVVTTAKKSKGYVTAVHIESSASTLRNTGAAKNKTHLELSKDRANGAANFVLRRLKDRGIALPRDRITLDHYGEEPRRNGTSGPDSPYPCPQGVDPKYCPKGNGPPPSQDCPCMEGFDTIAAYYDEFKYVHIKIFVSNEVLIERPGETIEEPYARLVLVDVDRNIKTRRPPRTWRFRHPKKAKPYKTKKKGKHMAMPCPEDKDDGLFKRIFKRIFQKTGKQYKPKKHSKRKRR